MTLLQLRTFLIYCTIFNYAVLLIWFFFYMTLLNTVFFVKASWYRLTAEQFNTINVAGITLYKCAILFLNLIPLIALHFTN